MLGALILSLIAVAPSVSEGDAQAFTTLFDAKSGTALADTASANVVRSTVSDASGAFKFAFLLPGTYVLRATPPSGSVYKPALRSGGLTIVTGQEATGQLIILGR